MLTDLIFYSFYSAYQREIGRRGALETGPPEVHESRRETWEKLVNFIF